MVLVTNSSPAGVEVGGPQRLLPYGNPGGRAHLEDEVAGDPLQDPGVDGWGECGAAADEKEVRLRALGQLSAVVAHQGLGGPGAQRLLHGERVVEEVVRLDARIEGRRVVAHDGRPYDADAARRDVGRRLPVRPDDDHDRGRGAVREVVTELAGPAGQQQPDAALAGRIDGLHGGQNAGP